MVKQTAVQAPQTVQQTVSDKLKHLYRQCIRKFKKHWIGIGAKKSRYHCNNIVRKNTGNFTVAEQLLEVQGITKPHQRNRGSSCFLMLLFFMKAE